ncbi:B9 domain-containing protein [Chloropicon primus]|uniref:B9 domain-containing protein 2 n=1 Tax=Chloropicon primus TaxID=1764295 RepID=A0A5B8MLH1_9CHLO|nr:B9 domain-containing protein [Chloropicon primus]UPR00483.1 B9 domain-containing protein [Chloropicon primus]|eukprot:QDZ21269.1 B9 domain-containing protein [Chloropicon primus]
MRDALKRSVANLQYGRMLSSAVKDKDSGSDKGSPSLGAFRRSSFLQGDSFREEDKENVEAMPSGDVFVMGTVVGLRPAANSELGGWGKSLWCEWKVVKDDKWSIVRGGREGLTHKALPSTDDGLYVWQSPLNVQLRTKTSFDWPKLCFTIFERDGLMSTDTVFGYSLVSLPMEPGYHRLEAKCWRPTSRVKCIDCELSVAYTGIRPELRSKSLIWQREGPYMNMQTVGIGAIELELNIVFSKEIDELFDIELTETEASKSSQGDLLASKGNGASSLAEEPQSEGLRIVRSRRGKRFNEVTSSLVAANMMKKSVGKKFDPMSNPASPFPSSQAAQGSAGGVDSVLSPADQARADRRQRMQALMQDREQRRAERAQRKNTLEDQPGDAA